MRGGLAWLAWLGAACVPGVSPDEAQHEDRVVGSPPALAAVPAEADGAFELALDDAPPRPVSEALASAPGRDLAPAHAERAGWSADGHTFAYCRRVPDLECNECRLIHQDGVSESFESGPGCGEGSIPAASFDARVAGLGLTPGATRWPAGAQIVLVVETRKTEQTNAGQPRAMLGLGARDRDGGPVGWLLHVDPCEGCGTDQVCAAQAHFDAVALDPRGTELAVLIHALASDGSESLRVERIGAQRVVEAAHARASTPAR